MQATGRTVMCGGRSEFQQLEEGLWVTGPVELGASNLRDYHAGEFRVPAVTRATGPRIL